MGSQKVYGLHTHENVDIYGWLLRDYHTNETCGQSIYTCTIFRGNPVDFRWADGATQVDANYIYLSHGAPTFCQSSDDVFRFFQILIN